MFRKALLAGFTFFLVFGAFGCKKEDAAVKINLDKVEAAYPDIEATNQKDGVLRFAIGAMVTPREGYAYYKHFLDYVGKKLNKQIQIVDRETYDEVNKLIMDREVDFAFVCGRPYVDLRRDDPGVQILVAPQAFGGTSYYSYIIVQKDSPAKSLADLRGKKFAFTDLLSNSGKLAPTYALARMNETPDSFFKEYVFTNGHDKSIKAVAQGIADGAAVDSLIWEYVNQAHPEYTSKTKIIQKLGPYGIPPVVVRSGFDPQVAEEVRQIFLNSGQDENGRELLKGMQIEKFVLVEDKIYDSIREMERWVEKTRKTK